MPVLRYSVFAVVAFITLAAAATIAVQRRAINPFGRLARAIRDLTDPLLKPLERRLLRSGGNPQSAPWWLIGVSLIGGILAITGAQWIAGQVSELVAAAGHGGRSLVWVLVDWTFGLLMLALIVRVIGSWLGATQWTPWMRPFHWLTEWMLRPLRQVLPPFGPFDLSPLVAWFLLSLLRSLILGIL